VADFFYTAEAMNPGELILIVAGGVLLLFLIWLIATYNRFIRLRQYLRESWADIDVELKRRYDLIPNLVNAVKGYAAHERETLEAVIRLRNQAVEHVTGQATAALQGEEAEQVGAALRRVLALAESYPQLKADQNFLSLQHELAMTEDRIAAARRFYNANVRDFTQLRDTFPSNMIAGVFGISDAPAYFELTVEAERVAPRVEIRH
jgi:LemA protein